MHIWIVEMWDEETREWEPTVGIGMDRSDARKEKQQWELRNPSDTFRVKKYVRIENSQ